MPRDLDRPRPRLTKASIDQASIDQVSPRLDIYTDHCWHATRIARLTYYLTYLIPVRENSHVLVAQYRQHRRHAGSNPYHVPVVPRLDLHLRLRLWRFAGSLVEPCLPGAAFYVRLGARIRSHLHGTRIWRVNAGRNFAADRRRRTAGTHSRKAT